MAKRRDVLMANIYFSDEPQSKVRPCIVLSDEHYDSGFLLVAPITGARDPHCLLLSKSDATCELTNGSTARADVIMRISTDEVARPIGQVTAAFYDRMVGKIIGLIR